MTKLRTRRLLILYALIVAGFLALTGRLWYIQIYRGAYYAGLAERNRVRTDTVDAMRGVIYDRNGVQLVDNVPSFAVTMVYAEVPRKDRQAVIVRLAELTGLEPSDFDSALTEARANPGAPAVLLEDVPRDRALAIIQDHVDLPGINVSSPPVRSYPEPELLSHVLGYVGRIDPETYRAAKSTAHPYEIDDDVGKAGLERQFEGQLRGSPGSQQVEVDVGGRVIRVISAQPATPGKSLLLTIDMGLERAAASALRAGLQSSHATTGAVVVMSPRTGDVLASVTMPSYDNNLFTGGIAVDDWQRLVSDPDRPLLDRAMGSPMPIGTLFTPFVAAAALQEGIATPDAARDCPETVEALGTLFRNSQARPAGRLTLRQAFVQGCDSLILGLVDDSPGKKGLGPARLTDYAGGFGFGRPTGIDVAGEVGGIVPSPAWQLANFGQPWTILDTYTMALGRQNLLVTPLQVAVAMSAFGNGGALLQPRIVERLIDTPEAGQRPALAAPAAVPVKSRQAPVDATTVTTMRAMLRQASLEGSGSAMAGLPFPVAGLPGTAEPPVVDRVLDPAATSWWAGYAPADNPDVTVVVVVPGGGRGDETAQSVARSILSAYGQLKSAGAFRGR